MENEATPSPFRRRTPEEMRSAIASVHDVRITLDEPAELPPATEIDPQLAATLTSQKIVAIPAVYSAPAPVPAMVEEEIQDEQSAETSDNSLAIADLLTRLDFIRYKFRGGSGNEETSRWKDAAIECAAAGELASSSLVLDRGQVLAIWSEKSDPLLPWRWLVKLDSNSYVHLCDIGDSGVQNLNASRAREIVVERGLRLLDEIPLAQVASVEQRSQSRDAWAKWEAKPQRKVRAISMSDFLAKDLVEPDPIIPKILHAGQRAMLAGPSKAGKTLLLSQLGLAVASGTKFLQWEIPAAANVLYINFELAEFYFRERIKTQYAEMSEKSTMPPLAELPFFSLNLRTPEYVDLRGESLLFALREIIEETSAKLVILDPIYKLYSDDGNENDVAYVMSIMNLLEKIQQETKCALVFGHHFSKGSKAGVDPLDRSAGSGGFARDGDLLMTLTPRKEEGYALEMRVRAYRDPSPLTIDRADSLTWKLSSAPALEKPARKSTTPAAPTFAQIRAAEVADYATEFHRSEEAKQRTGIKADASKDFARWSAQTFDAEKVYCTGDIVDAIKNGWMGGGMSNAQARRIFESERDEIWRGLSKSKWRLRDYISDFALPPLEDDDEPIF